MRCGKPGRLVSLPNYMEGGTSDSPLCADCEVLARRHPEDEPESGAGNDEPWSDKPDHHSERDRAAHPTRTGRHDIYAEAMTLVGNRHSKGALVGLVNALLAEADGLRRERDELRRRFDINMEEAKSEIESVAAELGVPTSAQLRADLAQAIERGDRWMRLASRWLLNFYEKQPGGSPERQNLADEVRAALAKEQP